MKNLADVNVQAAGHRILVKERHDGVTILLDGEVLYDSDEKAAKGASVERQLAAAAGRIDLKDEGPGAVQAVLFALEAIEDVESDDELDRFGYDPHVRVLGEDRDTVDGLFLRHHVLSSALAAIHIEMDETVEEIESLLYADAPTDSDPKDLN